MHLHTHRLNYLHTYIPTFISTYLYSYLHTYIHMCILTYMHICVNTFVSHYLHAYFHTYKIHAFVHAYIHVHSFLHVSSIITTSGGTESHCLGYSSCNARSMHTCTACTLIYMYAYIHCIHGKTGCRLKSLASMHPTSLHLLLLFLLLPLTCLRSSINSSSSIWCSVVAATIERPAL